MLTIKSGKNGPQIKSGMIDAIIKFTRISFEYLKLFIKYLFYFIYYLLYSSQFIYLTKTYMILKLSDINSLKKYCEIIKK